MRFPSLPIRRIFEVVNGGTPTVSEENWGGDVAWATPVDLASVHGDVITSTARTLTRQGLVSGSRAVPTGSLVVSTRAPIGYVAETASQLAFNQGCRGLVPRHEIDSRFFRHQLSVMGELLQSFGQGSTFMELSTEGLASTPIAVPTLSTQRAIADYLDTETARIDALIEKKKRMIELLEERRQETTLAAVSGKLTTAGPYSPVDIPWLNEVPSWWSSPLLRLVAVQGTGHTPSRSKPEWWHPDECVTPWITTGEVAQVRSDRVRVIYETRENVSPAGLANSSAEIHPEGTVFLCRTASAGYSGIMGVAMATSQDFATWTCSDVLRPEFLLLCLRAMRQDLLGRLAVGSTHKTIYMPDIQALKIPLPDVDEQDVIIEKTNRLLNRSFEAEESLVAQVDLLAEKRQALITAAVTGELEIPGVAA